MKRSHPMTTPIYHDHEEPDFRVRLKGTNLYLQQQFDAAGILARVTWTPCGCAAHFDNRASMLSGVEKMTALAGVQPRHIHRFAEGGEPGYVVTFNFKPQFIQVGAVRR